MDAPDKIYLSVGKGEDWVYAMWTPKTPEEQKSSELHEHEEYIRKDALLEWTKDNLLECEVSNDETDYGRIDVYKKLIDKINSL